MSEVLIIARTRMRDRRICVGALDLSAGKLIRLMDNRGRYFDESALFRPRQIWDVTYEPKHRLEAPHMEDVFVRRCAYRSDVDTMGDLLNGVAAVTAGSPTALLQGTLTFGLPTNRHGNPDECAPIIGRAQQIPTASLAIWQTDRILTMKRSGKAAAPVIHYVAPPPLREEVSFRVKYTGFENAPIIIPHGSFVSLSLARWWDPRQRGRQWEKCHLQLCDVLWTQD